MSVWLTASVLLGFALGFMLGVGIDPRPFIQVVGAVLLVYGFGYAVDWLNQRDEGEWE